MKSAAPERIATISPPPRAAAAIPQRTLLPLAQASAPPPEPAPLLVTEATVLANPVPESAAERAADRKAALAARQARIDESRKILAARRDKAVAEATARAERGNPARVWVQVAGGANQHDLPRAWAGLKAKWPKPLTGRTAWTTHYRYTNRLLIGPFKSADAAMDFVDTNRGAGFATFMVRTEAGDVVEHLGGK